MSDKTEAVLKELPRLRRYALVLLGERNAADDEILLCAGPGRLQDRGASDARPISIAVRRMAR
ncbi:MAG: hypothetical protein VW169_02485 [Rhodospirillaceae bacterium]